MLPYQSMLPHQSILPHQSVLPHQSSIDSMRGRAVPEQMDSGCLMAWKHDVGINPEFGTTTAGSRSPINPHSRWKPVLEADHRSIRTAGAVLQVMQGTVHTPYSYSAHCTLYMQVMQVAAMLGATPP
jgi:hypothetical protein